MEDEPEVDYDGNVISPPQRLTLEQVLPGLPPIGIAGKLSAARLIIRERGAGVLCKASAGPGVLARVSPQKRLRLTCVAAVTAGRNSALMELCILCVPSTRLHLILLHARCP